MLCIDINSELLGEYIHTLHIQCNECIKLFSMALGNPGVVVAKVPVSSPDSPFSASKLA